MEIKLYLTLLNFGKLNTVIRNLDYATLEIIEDDGTFIDCILKTEKLDLLIIQLLMHVK